MDRSQCEILPIAGVRRVAVALSCLASCAVLSKRGDEMKLKSIGLGAVLLAAALAVTGCTGLSCGGGSGATTESVTTTVSTTSTTLAPTTTSSSTTTTSSTSTTSTTLSALGAYQADMRAWADKYGPGLAQAYSVMSGANFTNPTAEQVQAAKDLDSLMGPMVNDLKAIQAPPDLASAHADFLASLKRMAGGAHDLSQGLQNKQSLLSLAAVATIAAAWQQGTPARTTLEQALGFSLSG
jgi:hypothetical protein